MTDTPQPVTNARPGSPYAVEHGCTCPIVDNANGAGAYGGAAKGEDGQPLFWLNETCPLHGKADAAYH